MAVQVTTCRGRGHVVSTALQAAQVVLIMQFISVNQSIEKNTVRIRSAFKLAVKADKEFKNNTTIRVSFSKMSADERLLRKT